MSDQARIIVYAGTESVQSATRVWLTLDYLGLGDRAALLDGGLALWRAEGRPLSSAAASVQAVKFTAHPAPQLIVSADWVGLHLDDRNVQLLDARLPEFYSGANAGGMPRAGHIPGARNVPFTSVFAENGKLAPPQSLRVVLNAGGSQEPALTVSYCHIGQQATVLYFVARYLGLNARLYDGSFREWSGRSGLPVEPTVVDQALASGIDSIFSPLADGRSPGMAVLVRNHGRTLFQGGYGIRDLRTSAKIDAQTDFRLASFTKQFTAVDNCDLEALGDAANQRHRWEFLVTAAPLSVPGGTGSPLNPIATF